MPADPFDECLTVGARVEGTVAAERFADEQPGRQVEFERGQPDHVLGRQIEQRPRGGQDPHLGEIGEDVDQVARGVEHVLAVVEHDQQPRSIGQRAGEFGRGVGRSGDAGGTSDRADHVAVVADSGEFDDHDIVAEFLAMEGDRLGDRGLADPADPGDRDQPEPVQGVGDRIDLGGPAQQVGCAGDRRSRRRRGPQRFRPGTDPGHDEFVDPFRFGQPGQPGQAPIDRLPAVCRRLGQHAGHGLRNDGLSAVRGRHDTGTPGHGRTEVVAVAFVGFTDMQPDPHPDRCFGGPGLAADRLLDRCRCGCGVVDPGERRCEGITGRGEHIPTVGFDRFTQQPVVHGQRRRHRPRVPVPQRRRPLHIGEQERHHPGRSNRCPLGHTPAFHSFGLRGLGCCYFIVQLAVDRSGCDVGCQRPSSSMMSSSAVSTWSTKSFRL